MKRFLLFITALCSFPLDAMELTDTEHRSSELSRMATVCKTINKLSAIANELSIITQCPNMCIESGTLCERQRLYITTLNYQGLLRGIRRSAQEFLITRIHIQHDLRPIFGALCLSEFYRAVYFSADYFSLVSPSSMSFLKGVGSGFLVGAACIAAYVGYRRNEQLLDAGNIAAEKIKQKLKEDPRIIQWLAQQQSPQNPAPNQASQQ